VTQRPGLPFVTPTSTVREQKRAVAVFAQGKVLPLCPALNRRWLPVSANSGRSRRRCLRASLPTSAVFLAVTWEACFEIREERLGR
jgi:hypothetical protein